MQEMHLTSTKSYTFEYEKEFGRGAVGLLVFRHRVFEANKDVRGDLEDVSVSWNGCRRQVRKGSELDRVLRKVLPFVRDLCHGLCGVKDVSDDGRSFTFSWR